MKNLYIDFDGVIADTINVSYKLIDEAGILRANEKECQAFYKTMDWQWVLNNSAILNDGMNCLNKLTSSGKFNVYILTHIISVNEIVQKVRFIRKFNKDITVIPVPKELSKTMMVCAKGAILVDDFVFNLEQWKNAGGISVRFDLDMDGKGFPVIDRLDKLIDMF